MRKYALPLMLGLTLLGCGSGGNGGNPSAPPSGASPTLQIFVGNIGGVGHVDGIGAAARFEYPAGIATDSAGNVYVADGDNTIRKITPAGAVSTLAGTAGVTGSTDGNGTTASFSDPTGVAVDSAGNVYVADSGNEVIRKITPAGVVSTLAGAAGVYGHADGLGAAASFSSHLGVTVDGAGNVYVADAYNNTIRKITPAGLVSTLAGTAGALGSANGVGAAARFSTVLGVAVDNAGNLYAADALNHLIRKVTPAGVVTTLAGNGNSGFTDGIVSVASFTYPCGVSTDSAGNVYVVDSLGNSVRKITPAGMVSTLAGPAFAVGSSGTVAVFIQPSGIAVGNSGNIYVADTGNSTIRLVAPTGAVSTLAGSADLIGSANGSGTAASFAEPAGVATDSAGNIYVADTGNGIIRKITPAGIVSTLAGTAGTPGNADGSGAAASFNYVNGVATDSAGNVYVADSGNDTIRKITPAGVVSTLAGSAGVMGSADGTGTAARFAVPFSLATDSAGNIYVADSGNDTIRKITPAGVVSTLAGTPGVVGSNDGTGAAAQFDTPFGITTDSAGNLYVVDGNYTIRKVTPAGVVTTLAGKAGVSGSANGSGAAARFDCSHGAATDSAGNVYVADTDNNAIRKITPAGVVSTLVGNVSGQAGFVAGALPGGLAGPMGVAISGSSLYITTEQGVAVVKNLP